MSLKLLTCFRLIEYYKRSKIIKKLVSNSYFAIIPYVSYVICIICLSGRKKLVLVIAKNNTQYINLYKWRET